MCDCLADHPDPILSVAITDVRRLRLEPGDVLVVKTAAIISARHADAIQRYLVGVIGAVPIIVMGPDCDLGLLTTERETRPIKRVIDLG